jgi:hypothetical protein
MNGFGHAYLHAEKLRKSGKNFKFIPGCEMYVHPDLKQWQKDLQKSKEKPVKDESILTPLTAVVDGNDETTDIGTDEAPQYFCRVCKALYNHKGSEKTQGAV